VKACWVFLASLSLFLACRQPGTTLDVVPSESLAIADAGPADSLCEVACAWECEPRCDAEACP